MVDRELEMKVLGVFYDKWFSNFIGLLSIHRDSYVCDSIDADKNEILKAIRNLESQGMLNEPSEAMCTISSYGIDVYEMELPPSQIIERIEQRKHILEILKESYDQDIDNMVSNEQLASGLGVESNDELRGQLRYLEDRGLIKFEPYSGGAFLVQLTAEGDSLFEGSPKHEESVPMASAYRVLFVLENHLRSFVEKRLRESFGTAYWADGISKNQQRNVDGFKDKESKHPWQVSTTKSNMEYLQFTDLLRIIKTNQEVFREVFSDIEQIELRLNELEEIRNAVAHMRTLSKESMIRLEQYNRDLLNLTGSMDQ